MTEGGGRRSSSLRPEPALTALYRVRILGLVHGRHREMAAASAEFACRPAEASRPGAAVGSKRATNRPVMRRKEQRGQIHGVLLTAAASWHATRPPSMARPHPCLVLLAKLYCKVE